MSFILPVSRNGSQRVHQKLALFVELICQIYRSAMNCKQVVSGKIFSKIYIYFSYYGIKTFFLLHWEIPFYYWLCNL